VRARGESAGAYGEGTGTVMRGSAPCVTVIVDANAVLGFHGPSLRRSSHNSNANAFHRNGGFLDLDRKAVVTSLRFYSLTLGVESWLCHVTLTPFLQSHCLSRES
jgi:hypothetical protein